ncbi:MAG: endonuclease/exonuclease/phosphatase family protein [Saprospiraceae bacterium]|nr:endonuclease/exonuclease/phosphatase family protein [Saprospiraceae bacterium]
MKYVSLIFLCLIPFISTELPLKNLPHSGNLCFDFRSDYTIMSYNVWGLPISLPTHDQGNRFLDIADSLIYRNADVLCLQEIFSKKFRDLNVGKLAGLYQYYSDYHCNKTIIPGFVKDCYGGLATFSKYEILEEQFYAFPELPEMRWEEKIGAKGFLLTKIEFPSGEAWVLNTHLYSGPDAQDETIRMEQIKFIHEQLEQLQTDLPIFMAGDFNIAHPGLDNHKFDFPNTAYEYISSTMGFNDSVEKYDKRHQYFTINPGQNRYCDSTEGKQKLDYIFYKNGCRRQISIQKNYVDMREKSSRSDHLAFAAVVKIK